MVTDVVKLLARRKSAVLGRKSAKLALLEYRYGMCTVRYGKYNTAFPYRTFSKNSIRNSVSYFLPKFNRNSVPNRTVVTSC